jgi:hypothetical protein
MTDQISRAEWIVAILVAGYSSPTSTATDDPASVVREEATRRLTATPLGDAMLRALETDPHNTGRQLQIRIELADLLASDPQFADWIDQHRPGPADEGAAANAAPPGNVSLDAARDIRLRGSDVGGNKTTNITKNRRVRIGLGALALLLLAGGGTAIVITTTPADTAPSAPAGRWEQISQVTNAQGEVVRARRPRDQWDSMVIYPDGKLTTDDSCRGTADPTDGRWRLTFDCALGSVICDGTLLANVKVKTAYGDDETGNRKVVSSPAGEALQLTCPEGDTYLFVHQEDIPPTIAPTPR